VFSSNNPYVDETTPMTSDPQLLHKLSHPIAYPVVFTENVFDPANRALVDTLDHLKENRVHRAMVFIDSNVADAQPELIQQIILYFDSHSDDIELAEEPRVIPGGEIIKNDMEVVGPMISAMIDAHLCRHSYAIIVGGGAVLDTVGLAAALMRRGIRVVRIPTTFFAQVNAGLGLEVSVNFDGQKNSVGSFAPPFAVLNDWQFFYSLTDLDWLGGVTEAFRLALLFDGEWFDELYSMLNVLPQRRSEDLAYLQSRTAQLYLNALEKEGDPLEAHSGRALDLGHWSAYKLEAISGFEIPHTEALAMGVLIDACYASRQGWLSGPDFERIYTAFAQLGVPLWFPELEEVSADGNLSLFHGIPDFQEHKGGMLSIPFPTGFGSTRMEYLIDLAVMEDVLEQLKCLAQSSVELQNEPL